METRYVHYPLAMCIHNSVFKRETALFSINLQSIIVYANVRNALSIVCFHVCCLAKQRFLGNFPNNNSKYRALCMLCADYECLIEKILYGIDDGKSTTSCNDETT